MERLKKKSSSSSSNGSGGNSSANVSSYSRRVTLDITPPTGSATEVLPWVSNQFLNNRMI